jgi:hypothetical protein
MRGKKEEEVSPHQKCILEEATDVFDQFSGRPDTGCTTLAVTQV